MRFLLIVIFSITLNLNYDKVAFGQGQAPIVTIPDGQLRGTINKTINSHVTYYSYRGIPYAKKPVGDLRFAPPVKNDPWTGILNATADRDACVQVPNLIDYSGATNVTLLGSEDCLYINVYTTNVNGALPVMVWIYGGGFYGGSSDYNTYGPDYLIEKDVVFVAFNYRLGIFGFLSTQDLVAPGNWGIKDQVLALKWVKANIKRFGGDPSKVTIFGESAGGVSVSYLLQSAQTHGLFRGAIMESGTSVCPWALTRSPEIEAFRVGVELGILTSTTRQLVRELRKVDYRTLKLAENNVTASGLLRNNVVAGLSFGVVKEPNHPGAVFSDNSWKSFKDGKFHRVPIIAGFNSLEVGFASILYQFVKPVIEQFDNDKAILPPHDMTRVVMKRLDAGLEIWEHYFNMGKISTQLDNLAKFVSNDMFNRPITETIRLASEYVPAYFYEFSYKGLLGDPLHTSSETYHGEELAYLFVTQNRTVNEQDHAMIEKLVTLWTNFAKTGNPTPQSGSQNGTILGGLIWSPNEPHKNAGTTTKYLNISETLTMETNPFQNDWTFYQNLYSKYGDPPYATY